MSLQLEFSWLKLNIDQELGDHTYVQRKSYVVLKIDSSSKTWRSPGWFLFLGPGAYGTGVMSPGKCSSEPSHVFQPVHCRW